MRTFFTSAACFSCVRVLQFVRLLPRLLSALLPRLVVVWCLAACVCPVVVSADTVEVVFKLSVDDWPSEASWNVIDNTTSITIFPEDKLFSYSYQSVAESIFLESGPYLFVRKDSYGDGGISASIYLAEDPDIILIEVTKYDYESLSSIPFSVPDVVDECDTSAHNCHEDASCVDAAWSYTCSCNDGYAGDGVTFCIDTSTCVRDEDACGYGSLLCEGSLCLCDAAFYGDGTNVCYPCSSDATSPIGSTVVTDCVCNEGFVGGASLCTAFSLVLYFPFSEGVGDYTVDVVSNSVVAYLYDVAWDATTPFSPGLQFDGYYSYAFFSGSALSGIEAAPGVTVSLWASARSCYSSMSLFRGIVGDVYFDYGLLHFAGLSVPFPCEETTLHHLVFVLEDFTYYPRIYRDGVLLGSKNTAYEIEAPENYVYISDDSSYSLEGSIDEFAVFSEGLSADEVTMLYQSYGKSSVDLLDECETSTHNCHENASCVDTVLSYTCSCNDGYAGDGVMNCADTSTCVQDDACGHGSLLCEGSLCLCDAGFYGGNSTTSCYPCSSDATSPIGSTVVTDCVCNEGFVGGANLCTDTSTCVQDEDACGYGTLLCEGSLCLCDAGFYGGNSSTSCYLCSSDATSPIGSTVATDCVCNEGFVGGANLCTEFSLVLYFPFSEGEGDYTVDVVNNNVVAGLDGVAWDSGSPFSPGLQFDRYDSYAFFSGSALSGIEAAPGVTVSLWANLRSFLFFERLDLFRGFLGGVYIYNSFMYFVGISVTVPCVETTWQHWVFVLEDSTYYPRIYRDGVLVGKKDSAYEIEAPEDIVYISDNSLYSLGVSIDEFAVFSEGLSADEVTMLYQSYDLLDGCEALTHNCHENASCVDTVLSYTCSCNDGYAGDGVMNCTDTSTCVQDNDVCGYGSLLCEGSLCLCDAGFYGNSTTSCYPCSSDATSPIGSTVATDCVCNEGFVGGANLCTGVDLVLYFPFSEGTGITTVDIQYGTVAYLVHSAWASEGPFSTSIYLYSYFFFSSALLSHLVSAPGLTVSLWAAYDYAVGDLYFFRGFAGDAYCDYDLIIHFAGISVPSGFEVGYMEWHHWVFVLEDSTYYPRIYRDGVLVGKKDTAYEIETPEDVVYILGLSYIDEFAVFSEGLSADGVAALYQSYDVNLCDWISSYVCRGDSVCTPGSVSYTCECPAGYRYTEYTCVVHRQFAASVLWVLVYVNLVVALAFLLCVRYRWHVASVTIMGMLPSHFASVTSQEDCADSDLGFDSDNCADVGAGVGQDNETHVSYPAVAPNVTKMRPFLCLLLVLSFVLQAIAFSLPLWWVYDDVVLEETVQLKILNSTADDEGTQWDATPEESWDTTPDANITYAAVDTEVIDLGASNNMTSWDNTTENTNMTEWVNTTVEDTNMTGWVNTTVEDTNMTEWVYTTVEVSQNFKYYVSGVCEGDGCWDYESELIFHTSAFAVMSMATTLLLILITAVKATRYNFRVFRWTRLAVLFCDVGFMVALFTYNFVDEVNSALQMHYPMTTATVVQFVPLWVYLVAHMVRGSEGGRVPEQLFGQHHRPVPFVEVLVFLVCVCITVLATFGLLEDEDPMSRPRRACLVYLWVRSYPMVLSVASGFLNEKDTMKAVYKEDARNLFSRSTQVMPVGASKYAVAGQILKVVKNPVVRKTMASKMLVDLLFDATQIATQKGFYLFATLSVSLSSVDDIYEATHILRGTRPYNVPEDPKGVFSRLSPWWEYGMYVLNYLLVPLAYLAMFETMSRENAGGFADVMIILNALETLLSSCFAVAGYHREALFKKTLTRTRRPQASSEDDAS